MKGAHKRFQKRQAERSLPETMSLYEQTLNKLVALGESAAAAEAVREISKTLKQLNCKVRKVLPLECKATWDELMACTGEALVERHLLVD